MDNLKDKTRRRDFKDRVGSRPISDPIVRRMDDVSKSGEGIQRAEITRSSGVPAMVVGTPLLSDRPVGPGQRTPAAPPVTEFLLSVLRFKWTILAIFILVAAPAIAAIWTQVIPQYRVRGEVQIRPIIPRLVFQTDENGPLPFYEGFVNTQVSIARSLTVLQRVLDQKDVQETKWYKNPKQPLMQRLLGQTDTHMERLRDVLSVQPRRRTEIIDFSLSDASAKDAVVIVNSVLDQYIKYINEASDVQEGALYRQLTDQYRLLQNEINGLENGAAVLRESLGTATPEGLISARSLRLEETKSRLDELRRSIAVLKSQTGQANAADSNEAAIARAEGQPLYHQDVEWRTLGDNVRTIRHQIGNSVLKAKHPDMIRMEKDLAFADESLRLRETQLDEQWRNRSEGVAVGPTDVFVSPEQQLARAVQDERSLSAEFDKDQAEFKEFFKIAQELESANSALRYKRETFDAVRQRLEQKDVERGVPGSIKVLTRAFAPSQPSEDRRVVFTAMVLFMGLGMGGGAAFLRASRNQTIYAPKDMPPTMQTPFLGYIPLTRLRGSLGKSLQKEMQKNEDHRIESIRLVRTSLLSRLGGRGSATVLVTSATEGTGKSTFTMMLGKSLARAGKRVLVIDTDLRRMTLSKRFGVSDEAGFMESLRCKSVDKRHVFPTETSGLSIMPAGKPNDNGAVFEETANGAFKACIGQLRKQYDIILLDSSPILPVADAVILSSQVDGTIMVERELVSRRPNVADALAQLDSAGGRLMGTVFVGSRESGNYGYGYGY